ncbi:hypothetical protein O1M63_55565 [Streptomyces mirabilis]|nr:hypothetical protein [Streptomyces mirabilis]
MPGTHEGDREGRDTEQQGRGQSGSIHAVRRLGTSVTDSPAPYAVQDEVSGSFRRPNAPTSSAGTVTGSVYASTEPTPQHASRTQAASTNRAVAA